MATVWENGGKLGPDKGLYGGISAYLLTEICQIEEKGWTMAKGDKVEFVQQVANDKIIIAKVKETGEKTFHFCVKAEAGKAMPIQADTFATFESRPDGMYVKDEVEIPSARSRYASREYRSNYDSIFGKN